MCPHRLAFRGASAFLLSCLFLAALLAAPPPGVSEVTLDGSLGSRGPVSPGTLPNGTPTTYLISDSLGRRAGANLFHSFDRFNVSQGESATFTGPNDIRNVVGRVTGGSASSIDGILRSTIDGANLYLLNPSGILFGPNASLDVRGSFHASTADYLRFSDGGIFYANPSASSILSVASVEAFGFLSATPAPITVSQSALRVPDGNTLSVIGGNVSVTGNSTGYLSAPGGQVNLVGVASPGEVVPTASGPQVSSFERLGDVSLTGGSYIDASGAAGGSVYIRGGRLIFTNSTLVANTVGTNGAAIGADIRVRGDLSMNNSTLQVATTGAGNAGNINIESSTMQMRNMAIMGDITTGTGSGGNLEVTTGSLSMIEGAQILVSTYGAGNSGNLKITADAATLSSADNFSRPAAFFANTRTGSTGRGGNMELTIGDLKLLKGAQMDTTTSGRGNAGALTINADSILFSGRNARNASSGLFARTMPNPGGNAGPVTINTGSLEVRDGAQISSGSYGGGNGGNLVINADRLLISTYDSAGVSWNNSTGIFKRGSYGSSGAMTITTGDLQVLDGGTINTVIDRSGAGGEVVLNAGRIVISRATPSGMGSSVYYAANPTTTGPMGSVKMNCESLEVTAGGQVYIKNIGSGTSGNLEINASDRVLLTPVDSNGINTSRTTELLVQGYNRDAGKIIIHADSLSILDGARVNTLATGAGRGGDVEITAGQIRISGRDSSGRYSIITSQSTSQYTTGGSGNVKIRAGSIEVTDSAEITTQTSGRGNAGAITIEADAILIRGQQLGGSTMINASTSSSGNAGDILLEAGAIELLDGAMIVSETAGAGRGGNITIFADDMKLSSNNLLYSEVSSLSRGTGSGGTIHIEARDLTMRHSSIDASSSGPGSGGAVEIVSDHLSMSSSAKIQARTSGNGAAGSVNIDADRIDMQLASSIATSTTGDGIGGDITISADTMTIGNSNLLSESYGVGSAGQITVDSRILAVSHSEIGVSSGRTATAGAVNINVDQLSLAAGSKIEADNVDGQGGDILIHAAQQAVLSAGSGISSYSRGSGNAGSILINAPMLSISDSYITGNTSGQGTGGRIELNVTDLSMDKSTAISSAALGPGRGGAIQIHANRTFSMSGPESSVIASAFGAGDGGNIDIHAQNVFLDQSGILAAGYGSGNAGDVRIRATDFLFLKNSDISTSARRADGGNIDIQAGNMVRLMDSGIYASVGGGPQTVGGNIRIDPQYVILDNSRIVANAYEGHGGNIRIVANTFLADPYSIVDASSALGIDGSVDIQAPITNVSGMLKPLSQEFVNASALLREPCMARLKGGGKYSSFIVGSRDALPLEPGGPLPGILH